ncbi:MAG: hypothetical protein MUO26_02880 [Methanotrichaceae archaeon]|nr:hypothetical protein [Methanotrichaceae archaeon]
MAGFTRFSKDRKLIEEARCILNGGSAKVHKSTRSGFTTSAVIAAEDGNKRMLCVAPTNRILLETIDEASGGTAIIIPANHECSVIKEMIGGDTFLEKLPIPLPDCKDCSELGHCPVTRIIGEDHSQIVGITYQKLVALMLSKSNLAGRIKKELSKANIVMLDESHTIVLQQVVKVKAFTKINLLERSPVLNKVCSKWIDLNEAKKEEIFDLKCQGDLGHVGRHLSKISDIDRPLSFKQLSAASDELFELARQRKDYSLSENDILILRDIISLMAGHWFSISYISEPEGEDGNVYIAGNYWISIRALREFLTKAVPKATHLYVSGTLVEPSPRFYSELSGKEVGDVIFPDLRCTNSKMSIIPDSWKLNAHNFRDNLDRIVERIIEIQAQNPNQRIYLVSPSANKAAVIREKFKERLGNAALNVDYYRSDLTMGVKSEARICVAVGLAELPSNVYDHMAMGNDSDEKWINSQRLRLESVHAATWQTWSRVKDPEGKVESIVYCIGVRADQISDVVAWGPGRHLELLEILGYRLPNGKTGRSPKFKVSVTQQIEPPKVFAENRTSTRRDRHTVGEYIDRVENYDPVFIFSEFVDKMPIYNNRRNVHKLGIYNNPLNTNECETTAIALVFFLASRMDYCARQLNNGGYTKFRLNGDMLPKLNAHLQSNETIGFYQISLRDEIKWICFDIDDHNGNKGTEGVRADLQSLFNVLNNYEIPFLLEASGSPNSFHIWIFLIPTKTINGYRFARQIKSEAGIECEMFPKQKSLNKDAKYGNLVKVPLGVNRKTGKKSQFLNPENLEPFIGEVPLPAFVRLREIQEQYTETKIGERTRKIRRSSSDEVSPVLLGQDLRPCMIAIIESGTQLNGPEGDNMRVAIAAEAWNTGMSIENAIELYKTQDDFDPEKTRSKLDYIYGRYRPYRCETLRDQCHTLVSQYCQKCPRNEAIHNLTTCYDGTQIAGNGYCPA